MSAFLAFTVAGLVAGCIYALTATGLVVTYITSGVFNFAHGAIGMIAAFAYWELSVNRHWPTWAAVFVVLFVLAPLMGAVIERVLMRRLRGAPIGISLVVTVGLLLFLIGLATLIWDPTVTRIVPQFFAGHLVKIFGVEVSYHQVTVVVVSVLAALGLQVFLRRTRAGTAMRAVVDDPELVAMTGAAPARYGQLGWALGAMMAALAGILLVSLKTLDPTNLTLLVINGYAAAMFGRLRSLRLTFVGGLVLGLAENYAIGYLPTSLLSEIPPVVPMIALFIILLVLPSSRLETARPTLTRLPKVAGLRESVLAGLGLILVGWLVSGHLSPSNLLTAGHGLALGLIMLSLVMLTGYGGQVSLCQLTFAGIGAFTMSKVGGTGGSLLGILAATGISAGVGALIALPAIR
ncbi:MAG: ABC transporter permease subunit, partial [Acidimicrobiales bacterium]